MANRIKVRFNLGRGKNYMKWKIVHKSGTIEYMEPSTTQLVMRGCITKNNRKTADKIFNGEHKTVCAWILCDEIEIKQDTLESYDNDPNNIRLVYNPRDNPYWVLGKGTPADGFKFNEIASMGRKLYVTKF